MSEKQCLECDGSGVTTCIDCGGSGLMDCWSCKGTGAYDDIEEWLQKIVKEKEMNGMS